MEDLGKGAIDGTYGDEKERDHDDTSLVRRK